MLLRHTSQGSLVLSVVMKQAKTLSQLLVQEGHGNLVVAGFYFKHPSNPLQMFGVLNIIEHDVTLGLFCLTSTSKVDMDDISIYFILFCSLNKQILFNLY